MISSIQLTFLPENVHISFVILGLLLLAVLVKFVLSTLSKERPYDGFPVLSLPEKDLGPKQSWLKEGRALVFKGSKTDEPFQVITGTGPKIVLPNRYANELRSDNRLNLPAAFSREFFFEYPGFEAFAHNMKEGGFLPELVRTKLTLSLGLITEDLVDETTASVHDIFGESDQWHEVQIREHILDLVARLSSRVFLGYPVCRNERWLDIAKNYTVDAIGGAESLRETPSLLRPIAHWFLPQMRRLKQHVHDAERIITPEVEMRRARAQKVVEKGGKMQKTSDTIGWMYELAKEKGRTELSYVAAQLSLTMAAVHTSTEALVVALLDICEHPEVLAPLREEIIEVFGTEGWSKQALYKLRRMDSFLKESQRFAFADNASMNRLVLESMTLSDGTVLPANSRVMVIAENMSPSVYTNPETFDPWRFYNARQTHETQNTWQHVSLQDPSQLSFGWGKHGCPGRFFASNEIKVALCHLLLKYDWKMSKGPSPFITHETHRMPIPNVTVEIRRRTEEINLDIELNRDE